MSPQSHEVSPRPADFLRKLLSILEREPSDIISWEDGKIYVLDPSRLGNEILHKYFRHSKFSSFNRQLNYFGFKKIQGKGKLCPCVYAHEMLVGPELGNLLHIRRRTRPAPRHATPKDAAATALAMQQQREWEANFMSTSSGSGSGRENASGSSSRLRKVRRATPKAPAAAKSGSGVATYDQRTGRQRASPLGDLSSLSFGGLQPLPAAARGSRMGSSGITLEQAVDITSGLTFDSFMFGIGGGGGCGSSAGSSYGSGSDSGANSSRSNSDSTRDGASSSSGSDRGSSSLEESLAAAVGLSVSVPGGGQLGYDVSRSENCGEEWPMSTRSSSSDYSTDDADANDLDLDMDAAGSGGGGGGAGAGAGAEAADEDENSKFLWDLSRTLDMAGPFASGADVFSFNPSGITTF